MEGAMGNNMLLSSKVIAFEKAAAKKMGNRGQTGVTSLVGTAGRGPIGVGFACYSFSEVLAKYGGFGADYSLILAARQFYLEAQEGTKIYCMRTVHYDDLLAGTHSAAKGTLTLKTAAVAASAAVIDGLWQAPWFVQNGRRWLHRSTPTWTTPDLCWHLGSGGRRSWSEPVPMDPRCGHDPPGGRWGRISQRSRP